MVSTTEPLEQLGWFRSYPKDAFFQQHVYVAQSSQPNSNGHYKCFHDLRETYLATIHWPMACRNGPCSLEKLSRPQGEIYHYKKITCSSVRSQRKYCFFKLVLYWLATKSVNLSKYFVSPSSKPTTHKEYTTRHHAFLPSILPQLIPKKQRSGH